MAHHLLLTIILKALQAHDFDTDVVNHLSSLKNYTQSLLSCPFMLVAALAKAVIYLLPCSPITKNNVELTDGEVDHMVTILSRFTQDKLTRRYYSHVFLQVLCLLSFQPANITQFMKHDIVANLESLMEVSEETEADLIANILWKVIHVEDSEQDVITHSKVIQGKIYNRYT